MPSNNRLTNNSDETDFTQLWSGDVIFTIPYFQRPYRWGTPKLAVLHEDILRIVDDSDIHFGCLDHTREGRSVPSEPDLYDVIDGQQRVTTIFIYLSAVIKYLANCKITKKL